MIRSILLFSLALSGAALAEAPASEPVVAAERAFAAYAAEHGFRAGVLRYAHPEAIGFEAGPVRAREAAERRPEAPGSPKVAWWPAWAGVSRGGDFGFTSGPYVIGAGLAHGHYFTVWTRGTDGAWRWIYDGGPSSAAPSGLKPDGAVARLQPASGASRSTQEAMVQVRAQEAELARAAAQDAAAAYRAVLAGDGRLMGSPGEPGAGEPALSRELAWRGPRVTLRPLGGEPAPAGDMVFTYGAAEWTSAGKPRRGHYVRIWQVREEGWRLAADILLPARPPAQQAAEG